MTKLFRSVDEAISRHLNEIYVALAVVGFIWLMGEVMAV